MGAPLIIRPIQHQDNSQVEALILGVLVEFGCVGPGFASSDPELKDLFGAYQPPEGQKTDRAYWVIEDTASGQVLGGGGFAPLKGFAGAIATCELQKVYFHSALRGRGFGRKLLEKCLMEAAFCGYQSVYLETVSQMASAVGLYEKLGFQRLPGSLGNTGHTGCSIFMSRSLKPSAHDVASKAVSTGA